MTDRLPSDHPSIETVRVPVERHGGGLRLAVPTDVIPADETVVRIIVDERTRFASFTRMNGESQWLIGVYDTMKGASAPSTGTNRLVEWLTDRERGPGSSVEIDVIEPGFLYGLREPGTRTVYQGFERPSASLSAIARDLEDR